MESLIGLRPDPPNVGLASLRYEVLRPELAHARHAYPSEVEDLDQASLLVVRAGIRHPEVEALIQYQMLSASNIIPYGPFIAYL